MQRRPGLLHLRNGGTSVVLDSRHAPLPVIVYWGADLGDLGETELAALGTASLPQRVSGGLDQPAPLTLIPQESTGWLGTPGLAGHRDGRHFSTKLVAESIDVDDASTTATVSATDAAAGLAATDHPRGDRRRPAPPAPLAREPRARAVLARLAGRDLPGARRPRRAARHHRAAPARALAAAARLHDRRPRAREPARPAGLRREPRDRRRSPGLRVRARPRLRGAPGLERQPPARRRAHAHRRVVPRRERAPRLRRDRARRGRVATRPPGRSARGATGSTSCRGASTTSCGPARGIRDALDR